MSEFKQKSGKQKLNTVVGKNSLLEGVFEVDEGIRVDGALKGQLSSSGTLILGPTGSLEADPIRVGDAVIAGRVTGKLEAQGRVKLEPTAVVIGEVKSPLLIIEEGAVFKGTCDSGVADMEVVSRSDEVLDIGVKEAVG